MRVNRSGFTLVELLIVIIIIAVLAAVVVPRFTQKSLKSKEAALKRSLRLHREAIARFHADTGLYPATLNALAKSSAPAFGRDAAGNGQALTGWKGPYLDVADKAVITADGATARDPVSGTALDYGIVPPNVGRVRSSMAGMSSEGTLYRSW